ncbi:Restriction endonuclease [Vibrio crassostreae]|uniref:hypothetical protein n=1 Tax=Vibrio crassostreae TaxID=246167 RepID=UPI00104EC5BC|nr:hypothetical protein [Vibrio crassostreae]TCN89108.1 hypothetical protein EDB37_100658 [Vibrio crassostreae]CAK2523148.1 Restriction endonuclease [Vibrio crassostreae]CAK3970471.1 Restriction endonuclease [Vibrio crassostreae]
MDKIRICETNKKVFISDKEFSYTERLANHPEIDCTLDDLDGINCSDFPELFDINIFQVEDVTIPFLDRVWITRDERQSDILLTAYITAPDYAWHGDIAVNSILRELKLILLGDGRDITYEVGGEEETFWVSIYLELNDSCLRSSIIHFLNDLMLDLCVAEEKIRGFSWKDRYESDEDFFTKDLLIPLFQKIGYNHVRFNHGPREFGKDILLSETTKLFNTRHISVQVKAGNVSGKAGPLVDTLVSQIRDSFEVPVCGPGMSKQFKISEVYVVISGKYSENAKEKINAKINNAFMASIYFLDREDIEWLTKKHWPLK